MYHYLLCIWDDVEPAVYGPYKTAEERDQAARDNRAESGDTNGLYPLDSDMVLDGKIDLGTYAGGYLDPIELDD